MRYITKILLLGVLGFALIAPPHLSYASDKTGALISGAYLYEVCKRDEEGKEVVSGGHIACQSYISGLIDYHNLLRSLGTAPSIDFCVPNTVDKAKLQDIVRTYLKENDHHGPFIAAPAVSLALFESYPCE